MSLMLGIVEDTILLFLVCKSGVYVFLVRGVAWRKGMK